MLTTRRAATAILAAVFAVPAVAAEQLAGPPAPTPIIGQERAIAWAKEQREADARAARREASLLCATSAADLGLTEAVLARGGQERNPLVRNRAIRIGLSTAACLFAQREARGSHPKPSQVRKAKWVRLAAVAANIVVLAR